MSFDWAEFLTLAEALLRDPNSPGPEEASLHFNVMACLMHSFRAFRVRS